MDICKNILIFVLILSFLTFSLYGCAANQPASSVKPYIPDEEITFFIASDIHYLDQSLTDGKEAFQSFIWSGDAKHLDYIDNILDAFTCDIEKEKPDILIICGDLTNNGEKASHQTLAKKLKRIQEVGTSVYIIPGNHDISNPWARCFESTGQYPVETICDKGFREIYGEFGYNEAISRDEHTLSYLAAPSENLWLLMLDSNQYKNNMESNCPNADGTINPKTIPWIKKCLKMADKKNAQIIAVMHHSLLNHNDLKNQNCTIANKEDVLKLFRKYNVQLTFTGHIHVQHIATCEKGKYPIYDIATSCLAVYPQKYGILKYSSTQGFHYRTAQVDLERWARENGIPDEEIKRFREYSKSFFSEAALRRAHNLLRNLSDYSGEEKQLMAETLATLDVEYFQGTLNIDDFKNTPGYRLLEKANPCILKRYQAAGYKNINNLELSVPIIR